MDHLKAKPAVLVTDNKAMRFKAAKAGVAVVATSIIK